MKAKIAVCGLLLFALLLLTGCSTAPTRVTQADAVGIRKIAVVTRCPDQELKLFDRTVAQWKPVTSYAFGLLGGLVDVAILTVQSNTKIRQSLGGEPDQLREQLKDYPIVTIFNENFRKSLTAKYDVVYPDEVDEILRPQEGKGTSTEDYSILSRKFNADTALIVTFVHGLGVYDPGIPASVAISADISVVNISENRCVMARRFDTDRVFRDDHTIHEFEAKRAELYKKNIVRAMGLVSREAGIILDLIKLYSARGDETAGSTDSKGTPQAAAHDKRSAR